MGYRAIFGSSKSNRLPELPHRIWYSKCNLYSRFGPSTMIILSKSGDCELPSVPPPRIAAAREVVHASPGYEQSKLISSHSTVASVQHVGVRPIVPPGGVSWKQSCCLTGAPFHGDDDDDDDDDETKAGRGQETPSDQD